jgi:hypothetical protein
MKPEIVAYLRKSDFTLTCICGTHTTYGSSQKEDFVEGIGLKCRACGSEYYPVIKIIVRKTKPQIKRVNKQVMDRKPSMVRELDLIQDCGRPGCRAMSKKVCDNYCPAHQRFIERLEREGKIGEDEECLKEKCY